MSLGGDQGSPLFSVSLNILSRFPHDLDKVQLCPQGYGRIILATGANIAKITQQGHWALFCVCFCFDFFGFWSKKSSRIGGKLPVVL